MTPQGFNEVNCILHTPPGMSPDDCEPLQVFRGFTNEGQPIQLSCWKVTAEELLEINRTKKVWLMTWGTVHPPVALLGENPFEQDFTKQE